MTRIQLTHKDERILPVTINGKDVDLTFDAGSLETKNEVISMLDDVSQFRVLGEALFSAKNRKESDAKVINAIRKYTNDGIELCHNLSARFSVICPTWNETVGDNFIDLEVYTQLLGTMMAIMAEKETADKVAEDIEAER